LHASVIIPSYNSRPTIACGAVSPHGYKVIEVAPGVDNAPGGVDNATVRDMSTRQFLAYIRAVRRFVEMHRQTYDVVLEKRG
jgi:hypothetical protein